MGLLMRYYELITIIPSRYTDTEVEGILARVGELLRTHGAEVARIQNLGRVKLAYPVLGQRFATYIRIVFKGEARAVVALRQGLRLFGEIVRFTIIATEEAALHRSFQLVPYQEPIPASERERDDRPRLPRAPHRPTPVVAKPITEAELEKQIDKIIEEKVL